jgi:hypothetical protein
MGTKLPNGTDLIQTGVKLLKNLSLQPMGDARYEERVY